MGAGPSGNRGKYVQWRVEEEYRIDIEPAQIPHLLMAEKIAPGKAYLLVLATRSPVQVCKHQSYIQERSAMNISIFTAKE